MADISEYTEPVFADSFELKNLELLRLIGQGGMGNVYKARDTKLGTIVAVKILHNDLCANPTFAARFRREAENMLELSHPNIVKGLQVGEAGRTVYFTMEYIDGPDLARLVSEKGPMEPSVVLDIATQAAHALDYAYSKGKIHRDVKPANFLMTPEGVVKLSDLGLVKGETDPRLTGACTVLGTPYYMSPELVSGCADLDIRADLYSLGATLYHLLTGHPPFFNADPPVVMTKQVTDEIEIPAELEIPFGDRFRYLFSKLVSKRREIRYQSPEELLADLETLGSQKSAASPTSPSAPAPSRSTTAISADLFLPPTVETFKPGLQTVLDQMQIESLTGQDKQEQKHPPGSVLFYEGDNSRDFYILQSGRCEVLRSGKRLATIDQPGACFGEMSAILGVRRTATVRTLDKAACTIIPVETFESFLAEHPDLQRRVLEIALKRLRDLNERFVESQNRISASKLELLRLLRQLPHLSSEEAAAKTEEIYLLLDAPLGDPEP
jgi:serine/threonine protein kinase